LTPEYHPNNRGFDEFYGFLGHGGHDYFDLSYNENRAHNAIYRNKEIINDTGYLTDNLAREAVGFIERNKENPALRCFTWVVSYQVCLR
jgi:arylsulfatase A-like enzyme